MSTVRVLAYNILFGGARRERAIRDVVNSIKPDIAVFTEVTATTSLDAIADMVGPHSAGHTGRGASEYPVVVSRWPILESDLHGPPWAPRKWVAATVRPFGGPELTVHAVHLVPQPLWPFEWCRSWEVRFLLKRLLRHGGAPHVVAGDFNAVIGRDRQRRGGAPAWVRAQWWLQAGSIPRFALRRLGDAGYVDCYRACNPEGDGFTVPAWDPSARIDYVFAAPSLASALRGSDTVQPQRPASPSRPSRSLAQLMGWKTVSELGGEASDHLPVWADFEWPDGAGQ